MFDMGGREGGVNCVWLDVSPPRFNKLTHSKASVAAFRITSDAYTLFTLHQVRSYEYILKNKYKNKHTKHTYLY